MKFAAVAIAIFIGLTGNALSNGYEYFPMPLDWSPDSRYVAVAWPDNFDGYVYSGHLAVYDRYKREVWMSRESGWSSPAFLEGTGNGWGKLAAVRDGELVLLEPDDDLVEQSVLASGEILDCSVSTDADGKLWIVYSEGQRFGTTSLQRITPEGRGQEVLTDIDDDAAKISPVAGPGSLLVCYTRQPGDEGLFGYERLWFVNTVNLLTEKLAPEQLRDWDYHESNAVFLDSDTVIFQRGGWGDWHLYRRNLATGREWLETTDAQQPSLSADGRWLAFARRVFAEKVDIEYDWEIEPQVWIRDREAMLEYQASLTGVSAQFPAVSPDGKYIAWMESEGGLYTLKIRRLSLIVNR